MSKGWSDEQVFEKFPYMRDIVGPQKKQNGEGWDALFDARPDMMHAIFADIIKQTYATPSRVGQRPMPREEDVDLDWLMDSDPNREPLTAVLPKLVKVSERKFCDSISMSRATYQRMLKGEYDPDIDQLRRIANAIGKPPSYFIEYRRRLLFSALGRMLVREPQILDMLFYSYVTEGSLKKRRNADPKAKRTFGIKKMDEAVRTIHQIGEQFGLNVSVKPIPR